MSIQKLKIISFNDINTFNYTDYLFINDDLIFSNKYETYNHYITKGFKENRKSYITREERNIYKTTDWNDYIVSNKLKNFTAKKAWLHYLQNMNHISDETSDEKTYISGRKIDNILRPKYLDNNYLWTVNLNLNNNISNDIIISLATIPNRFISKEFYLTIVSLCTQVLKPKKIIINLCKHYKRNLKLINDNLIEIQIQNLLQLDSIIKINYTIDYGPITKILGLKNLNFDDNDKILILDDDWIYNKYLTYFYNLCYEIYNCEGIGIDEYNILRWDSNFFSCMDLKENTNIFYDNYHSLVYGWLSYSLKYKYVEKLFDFWNKEIKINSDIFFHDDIVVSIFCIINKLYICGINLIFPKVYKNRFTNDNVDALHNIDNMWNLRYQLEKYFLDKYNINYFRDNLNKNRIKIVRDFDDYQNINFNINNLNYSNYQLVKNINVPEYNLLPNYNINFVYINKELCLLTITFYKNIENNIVCNINKINCNINLDNNEHSFKQSFIIKVNSFFFNSNVYFIPHILKKEHTNHFTQFETNKISRKAFYSIMSFVNGLPNFKFKFFNCDDRINFIKDNYKSYILNLYQKLNINSYKADMFRYLYMYKMGGFYHDHKMILINYNSIINYNNLEYFFVDECYNYNSISNGLIYVSYNFKRIFENIIFGNSEHQGLLDNIFKSYKGNTYFDISGPTLIAKFINKKFPLFVTINKNLYNNIDKNHLWMYSTINDKLNNNVIIKINYDNYYFENNYLYENHYSKLWKENKIYNLNKYYSKINYIDFAIIINLSGSISRNKVKTIISKLEIKYKQMLEISFEFDYKYIIDNLPYKLLKKKIPYSLSLIKSISELDKISGEYFLICNSNIKFDNLIISNFDLKQIIENAPDFDILILNSNIDKTNYLYNNFYNLVQKDKKLINNFNTNAFIIHQKAVKYITKNIGIFKNNRFFIYTGDIEKTNRCIFLSLNTYVYKYNFFNDKQNSNKINYFEL